MPRDERYTMVKTDDLQEDAIQTASRKLVPAIQALYSTQTEFESVSEIADLFKKGVALTTSSDSESESDSEHPPPACETILTYPTPKVIAGKQNSSTLSCLRNLPRPITRNQSREAHFSSNIWVILPLYPDDTCVILLLYPGYTCMILLLYPLDTYMYTHVILWRVYFALDTIADDADLWCS
jgi:hypothetical protein